MGRPRKSQIGDNSKTPLTDEERDALATHFALKIIAGERIAAQKKADYDAAKADVSAVFKLVSAELRETRKDFQRDVIEVMGLTEAEYLSAEAKRARRHQMAGAKPPGAQLDLVDAINDTVDDAIAAEADGYRSGRRADDPEAPDNIASMFIPDWLRGWTRGQEVNAKCEAMAADVLARPKPGEMTAGEDPDEAEDGDDDLEPATIVSKARTLKKAGWTEPTAEEQSFEAAE